MADTAHMNPDFRARLMAMIAASGGRITIGSGFRSVQEQTQLWNAAVKKYGSESAARKWVAPPGKSHHNEGIAADLQGDLNLAHQLAPRFGLYFPMPWEKWHVEPLGSGANKDSMTTPPEWYTASVAKSSGSTEPVRPTLGDQLGAIDTLLHHTADTRMPSFAAMQNFGQGMDLAFTGQAQPADALATDTAPAAPAALTYEAPTPSDPIPAPVPTPDHFVHRATGMI